MIRRLSIMLVTSLGLAAPLAVRSQPASACPVGGGATGHGVVVLAHCVWVRHDPEAGPSRPTQRVYCGRPTEHSNGLWNRDCGAPKVCYSTDAGRRVVVDVFATLTLVRGRWSDPRLWCAADAQPGIDPAEIRDQAIRLLPAVSIGSAWKDSALVNAQLILWADTPTDRPLPALTLTGQHIQLRIHLTSAYWDYGDHTSQTTTTPGKPYTPTDPCHSAQCPHYNGHTYQHTGTVTITLTLTWHAQYRTDTTAWTDIEHPITGPPTTHTITVKQARAVLVPN